MAGTYGNSLDSIVLPSQDLHLRINEDIMPTQPEFTQDIQIQFVKAGFDLSKTACGHISDFMGPSGAISQNQGDTLHTPRCTSERLQKYQIVLLNKITIFLGQKY